MVFAFMLDNPIGVRVDFYPKMNTPPDIRALLKTWPRLADVASELGVKHSRVEKWHQVNRIPLGKQLALLRRAQERGVAVTAEWMLAQHADRGARAP